MDKNKIKYLLIGIVLYAVSTITSFFFFSSGVFSQTGSTVSSVKNNGNKQLSFDTSLPKTQACPLNGTLYSTQQKDWWKKHRPLGAMIENHSESRPQSGLTSADVVYEIVAEGGITRFLAMFYCQDAGIIGPIRSARTYYMDFLSEYGDFPLYSHVGGAAQPGPADALGQIRDYDWYMYNDLSQFNVPYPIYKKIEARQGRDVATEHTMYSTTKQLWDYAAANRKLTNVNEDGESWDKDFIPYKFKDDASSSQRGISQTVHMEFWSGDQDYYVDWKYNPKTNLYARNNGGVPHIDRDNNKQITAKTIVVLSMVERNANDGYENNVHLLYRTKGTGKATVFLDGKKINATWTKDSRTSRTIITDESGNEIKFNKGLLWFAVLPTDGVLTVK